MTKPIFLAALGAGVLAALPLHAQEAPAPAPAPAAPQAAAQAAPTKSFTPAEQAAIKSFVRKASIASFRAMSELTPEEMQALTTSKTSKAALLMNKKMMDIPVDPNLPAFLKEGHAQSKALAEELSKAVEANAPAEKINELLKKSEKITQDSAKGLSEHGMSMEAVSKEVQKEIQTKMGSISQKIIAENPEAAKDPKAMMKLMFTELANQLEADTGK